METILCIPGPWSTRSELVAAIAGANLGDYIFAGQILLHIPTKTGFTLELGDPDEELVATFQRAGQLTGLSDETLAAVAAHQHVVYLIGETGSLAAARAVAAAAGAVLRAGGVGVKVETAGKAFNKEAWLHLAADADRVTLADLFVVEAIQADDATFFSCGMHNLGLKDALVLNETAADAIRLLSIFCRYQVVESPVLAPGHTFSIAADAPSFRLSELAVQPYEGDELFENPFGMWEVKRV